MAEHVAVFVDGENISGDHARTIRETAAGKKPTDILMTVTWRAYLHNRPTLYDLDPKSQEAKVRFKPAGFAAKG